MCRSLNSSVVALLCLIPSYLYMPPLLSLDSQPILASYTSYAGSDYRVSPQASLSLSATFLSFLPLQLSSFSLVCSFRTNTDSQSHPVPLPHAPFEYRSHRIVGSPSNYIHVRYNPSVGKLTVQCIITFSWSPATDQTVLHVLKGDR